MEAGVAFMFGSAIVIAATAVVKMVMMQAVINAMEMKVDRLEEENRDRERAVATLWQALTADVDQER